MTQPIETQATILNVSDDATWKYSIEADIPAFDGDKSYMYMAWNKKQGPPPQVGATVLGTFQPYQRAKYYVKRGDIEDAPVDGTEKHYQITWNLIAARPVEAGNGAGVAPTTGTPQETPVRATSDAPQTPGTTYLAAPTTDERMAKELAKFRREIEGVNDRKAVSDILALVEPGTYTLDGLIEDAEKLAGWYNSRMAARCGFPLVEAAQELGAVVTQVSETEVYDLNSNLTSGVPAIINKPALADWVAEQGWQKDKIAGVLNDAGYASSAAYLDKPGNTVQGLASLLNEKLGW